MLPSAIVHLVLTLFIGIATFSPHMPYELDRSKLDSSTQFFEELPEKELDKASECFIGCLVCSEPVSLSSFWTPLQSIETKLSIAVHKESHSARGPPCA